MSSAPVRYLLFDVESVVDGALLKAIEYPDETYSPEQAIAVCQKERLEKVGREFIPYTFQFPVAVAVAKIDEHFNMIELVTLDNDQYRPEVMTRDFWSGWKHYREQALKSRKNVTLVTFNGRHFDIPLLELSAFRYGIEIGDWLSNKGPSYEQPRNRYNWLSHIDMQEFVTNFGATRFNGGLNLLSQLLCKPGKMGVAGHMVQDLYHAGDLKRINDYCRCDVLDTYFVFLRSRVLSGEITLDAEQQIVGKTMEWLQAMADRGDNAIAEYIDHCGIWENPWIEKVS